MTIELDHTIVPTRHAVASARKLADMKVNTDYGGRMVYWNEPDGHQWEMLTVSYARQDSRKP